MLIKVLLVAHIAVLGYWLGAELVINSTFRYVSRAASMPFAERDRLMDHVMDVDQHVRYALVLQAGLGTMLAALYGIFPGGTMLAWGAAGGALAWLALVEASHHGRHTDLGRKLATLDRGIRYVAIVALIGGAAAATGGRIALPGWLVWKLVAFAGVIGCGLAIRFALMAFYRTWREIELSGSNEAHEQVVRTIYLRATGVLGLLWAFLAVAVVLSITKPA